MRNLFLIITLFVGTYLHAQEPSNKPLKTNKQWEIGGNFAGAIVTGSIINNALFAQKNFTKTVGGKSKHIAHRYSINVSNFWEDNSKSAYQDNAKRFDIHAYVGKQWTHQQNKFQWYYGDDIEFDIQYTFHSNDSIRSLNHFVLASNYFVGVKYFISNQFSVAWEGALRVRLQQNRTGWDSLNSSLSMINQTIYAIRLLYKL